jgi:hypothetical protein
VLFVDVNDITCRRNKIFFGQFSDRTTGLTTADSGFDSRKGQGILLLSGSIPSLRCTETSIQWVLSGLSVRGKANHMPSSNDKVKNAWNYTLVN